MITRIAAKDRHFSDYGSLQTHWLFSFSDYHDPDNMNFGPLRVFNDDVIMPGAGFPDHPHHTMEIVTIVLDGALSHTDSMGNKETITSGEVQRMSAGEGVVHAECNEGTGPVHLYQLWFQPNTKTTRGYEQKRIDPKTVWTILASPEPSLGVMIHADATLWQLNLKKGMTDERTLKKGSGCFVYVTSGTLIIEGQTYSSGDQARIEAETTIELSAHTDVQAIVIEVQL